MMKKLFTIGLTGGIASGKSSAMKHLASYGVHIINADELGHHSYVPGTNCYKQILNAFGNDLASGENGAIDRKKLGSIVFSDKSKMEQLNKIVWPAIRGMALNRIEDIKKQYGITANHSIGSSILNNSSDKDKDNEEKEKEKEIEPIIVAIEAAILLEAGWQDIVDEVWVIYVPPDVAKSRLMERNGLSEEEAMKRINSQMSNDDRLKFAKVAINTNREPKETEAIVKSEYDSLIQRIATHSS